RTRASLRSAVELRLGEIRRRLAQDLVGALELTILALQFLHPLALGRRQPRPLARVTLGISHPAPQRLRRAPQLLRNRADRRPLRAVLLLVLLHQPDGPLPDLRRKLARSSHGSSLSTFGASGKPGAVHVQLQHPSWMPGVNQSGLREIRGGSPA